MLTENQELALKVILLAFAAVVALRLCVDAFGFLTRAWAGVVVMMRADRPKAAAFGMLFAGVVLAVFRYEVMAGEDVKAKPFIQEAKPHDAKKGGKS